ncbi:MAG TPA: acetate--CoA ligase family protein [Armatimonadota bacterium]|jgi:acetyltransferase
MLENFFTPKSVAVIGASAEPGKVGYDIVFNLIDAKFQGEIYPINPKAETIQGLKVYKTVLDVPGQVDLAVIVIPAKFVAATMEQLGQKGTKAVVIITAGFKEVGAEGKAMQQQVMDVAAKYGIRVIGPNCLGIISTAVGLNASFAPNTPKNGHIALVSQSGALACAILDWATQAGIGFSKFFTIGNQADVATNDLLKAWKDDPEVRVMVAYMEAIADGIEFMKIAEDVARVKPIVMVKSGTTAAGAKAAASHTGSLAGSDAAYDAAFKQSGVIRANTVEEFFDYSIAFANQPIPKGKRICIVTNAGGPGIICSDAIEKMGLSLATVSEKTVEILKSRVSPSGNFNNPIDVLGDAKAAIYKFATETVLQDEGVDGVIVIVTPQSSTEIVETAQAVADLQTDKPILTCFMGGTLMAPAVSLLMDNEVPNYEFPERAVSAFKAMVDYATWRNLPIEAPKTFAVDKEYVAAAFAKTRAEGRRDMNEVECADILRAYGFILPGNKLCATADEAVAFSNEIGYPVVMKIASPDILHKSDVGGVKVGLKNADEVRAIFESMTTSIQAKKPEANIWGVNIQQMVTEGKQTILGMSRDPQFGPMIMFGLGGIYVEVLKDVVFRIAPLNAYTANEMVHAIRSFKLLAGARGEKPSDINAVVEAIQRLSQLVTDFPEIIEMDINPLVALPENGGAIAIDSRISITV